MLVLGNVFIQSVALDKSVKSTMLNQQCVMVESSVDLRAPLTLSCFLLPSGAESRGEPQLPLPRGREGTSGRHHSEGERVPGEALAPSA